MSSDASCPVRLPTFASEQTAKVRSGTLGLDRPLRQRLGQQRDGRHQEQHPSARPRPVRSAMRSDVKVLPVPQAMISLPRSWTANPARTASIAPT